jgi:hypothetical protein
LLPAAVFVLVLLLSGIGAAGFVAESSPAQKQDLIIDQLERFTPQDAVSRNYRRGAWWWREDVAGAHGGTLLVTGQWREDRSAPAHVEADAPGAADNYVDNLVPALSVSPNVRGWHRIVFGIYSRPRPPRTHIDLLPFRFGVRLSNEPYPVYIQGRDDVPAGFQEVPWKEADLTGKSIEISQIRAEKQRPGLGLAAGIDYIRLEPLSAEEGAAAARAERKPPPVDKRLFALMDYVVEVQLFGTFETPDDIRAIVYRHKEGGFGRIYWRCYGSSSDNSLRVRDAAPRWTEEDEAAYRRKYGVSVGWMPYIQACRKFDPLQVACEYGRRIGVEVHAWVRMTNHRERPPKSNFWYEHPEYQLIMRDGTRLPRVLSFAHPEVRRYYVTLMRDIATTGVKGILLDWLRHPPAVGYEDEVRASFAAKYGVDMKQVPGDDPRIHEHHSSYIVSFLRDMRQALPGIEISARIRNMREFGLDAPTWVREGLVDTIVEGNWNSSNRPRLVEQGVLAVTQGTPVKSYVIAETSDWAEPVPTRTWLSADEIVAYSRIYRDKGVNRFGLYESTMFLWYPHARRAIWKAGSIMAGRPD